MCKGLLPTGTEGGKSLRGHKVGLWGESGVPRGEEMVLFPNSACFRLKGLDPRPVPLELLRLGCGLGRGSHPPVPGPRLLGSTAAASAAASSRQAGQVWVAGTTSDSRWRKAPQRMRGAERSLVTVGRSFTVAKGFVPLTGVGGEEGVRRARCPTGWGSRGGFWASEPGIRPYLLCPWGHLHSGPPCLPHSPLPSPAPSDTRSGTHRGKSSGGCCSQDASFCSEGEGGSGLVGKEQESPPPSSPLQQGRGLAQRPLQCQAPAR